MQTLLITYVIGGLVLSALAIPLVLGWVGPNRWYGFRVAQTLSDRDLWYAANAHAGWRLFLAGVTTVVSALLVFLVPQMTIDRYAWTCLSIQMIALGWGLTQSFLYVRRYNSRPK